MFVSKGAENSRKCCNEQLVLSVYANQEPLEKNIWCDAEKSL